MYFWGYTAEELVVVMMQPCESPQILVSSHHPTLNQSHLDNAVVVTTHKCTHLGTCCRKHW